MAGLWNQLDSKELELAISAYPKGTTLQIQTSEYAYNTTPPGFHFDEAASAPAVRALIQKGILKGNSMWRYYEVVVL